MCDSKKSKFIKQQEASGLLSSLEIKIFLSKMFCFNSINQVNTRYKMNEIVNKFLLAGYKFMPEMHLRQDAMLDKSGFTYSPCGPFTKKQRKNPKI